MPDGKAAGERCIHLTDAHLCAIFGHPDRPPVCASLRASVEMCGGTARDAFAYLQRLERTTRPPALP